MFCKNCGNVIKDEQTVCEKCGKEISVKPKTEDNGEQKTPRPNVRGWYKSRDGKLIMGVCAGLGKKYNKNPWLFRGIMIGSMFIFLGWASLAFYIVGSIVWPYDEELIQK